MITLPEQLERRLLNLNFSELMHVNEITRRQLVAAFDRRGINFPAWLLDTRTETPPDAIESHVAPKCGA